MGKNKDTTRIAELTMEDVKNEAFFPAEDTDATTTAQQRTNDHLKPARHGKKSFSSAFFYIVQRSKQPSFG